MCLIRLDVCQSHVCQRYVWGGILRPNRFNRLADQGAGYTKSCGMPGWPPGERLIAPFVNLWANQT